MSTRGALMVLCGLVCVLAAAAGAQPPQGFLPSATALRAATSVERTGHAWLVLPVQGSDAGLRREFALLHAPPRDQRGTIAPGTLKVASRFNALPEGLAAWEDRVYIVFGRENAPRIEPTGGPDGPTSAPPPHARRADAAHSVQRRVVTLAAAPTVAGTYEYLPPGTVEARAALPGFGLLEGFATVGGAPVALLGPDELGAGGWTLLRLAGDSWVSVSLPPEASLAGPEGVRADLAVRLVAVGTGVWLIVIEPRGETRLWRADVPASTAEEPAPPWTWTRLGPLPPSAAQPDLRRALLTTVDGEVYAVDRAGPALPVGAESAASTRGGEVRLFRMGLAASGFVVPRWVATESVGEPVGSVGLDGLGRMVLAWPEAAAAQGAPAPTGSPPALTTAPSAPGATRIKISEFSLWTGERIYSGSAKREGVLTVRDFQVLTFVIGGLMLAVMAFVLRSDATQTLSLPTGVSLARPAARVLAGAIDLCVAVLLASVAFGIAPSAMVGWHLLAPLRVEAWLPVLTAWGLVIALAAGQEWLTGRTLGKRLVGCEVLGLHKDPGAGAIEGAKFGSVFIGRPTFWQALLRNLIRWGVPPLGLLMVFDSNWRHAGDLLAGTVVVVPADRETPPDTTE
ncbi:MAG: RDD family protein [Phycisphaerales bacterium]